MTITSKVEKEATKYSSLISAPFDKAKRLLEGNSYRIASLKDIAEQRLKKGRIDYRDFSTLTYQAAIIIPSRKEIRITNNSPIIDSPTDAVEEHQGGIEFYLIDEEVRRSFRNSVQIQKDPIQTDRFVNSPVTLFLFEEYAKKYGYLLRDYGIKEMQIYPKEESNPFQHDNDTPFARQILFHNLISDNSNIDCTNRSLHKNQWLQGIRYGSSSKA